MKDLKESLRHGLTQLCLKLDEYQIDQLIKYLQLIVKWNKAYNLTSIDDVSQIINLHLLDSLAIIPHLQGDRWIDIGTGAGLPGIPLAIACPTKDITLLDSNGKKTRFLFQVILELKLSNVRVENKRAEDYQPEIGFDGILTRAVTSLDKMVVSTEHLLNVNGKFWAMKGVYPKEELSELRKGYKVLGINKIEIPGSESERHLVELARSDQ